jgi:hypothetical protein
MIAAGEPTGAVTNQSVKSAQSVSGSSFGYPDACRNRRSLVACRAPARSERAVGRSCRALATHSREPAVPLTLPPRFLLLALAAASLAASPARAQSIDDGLLVPRRTLLASVEYGRDRWDQYWEGSRRRTNENIGTITTRSVTGAVGYGVTERLSVFATLPHVRTEASQGVLHGLSGRQDLEVAAKYRVAEVRVAGRVSLGALLTAGLATPTSDYAVDFLPMSIGLGSRRAIGRVGLHLQDRTGVFVDAAAGHTWRDNVRLDRPAYYTDGRLYSTSEVAMPDVADYMVGVGIQRRWLCLPVSLVTQRTLGGGDIRRQDMPFVSNRMDFTRLQVYTMITLPGAVRLDLGAMRTLRGRNVGRSSAVTGGFTYAIGL